MGDGVVVLQMDDVRFIGIIVYIYDSTKRNKSLLSHPSKVVLMKVHFGYMQVRRQFGETQKKQKI